MTKDHRPDPDYTPAPALCLVCGREVVRVFDPRQNDYYWRHKRRAAHDS